MAEKLIPITVHGELTTLPKILPSFEGLTDFYDSEFFKENLTYEGKDLFIQYEEDHIHVRLWAPMATKVNFQLYNRVDEDTPFLTYDMERSEKGTFLLRLPLMASNHYYLFEVHHEEAITHTPGPYTTSVGVNGEKGYLLNLKETDPENFRTYKAPLLENPVDAVVYEVHVRDLSSHEDSGIKAKGKFLGFTEEGTRNKKGHSTGLSHLKEMGVTHVQLLPVFDFNALDELGEDGAYNWGYDPLNYNVPEGSYASDPKDPASRIRELKSLIMSLHKNGMGVIMDVVYNHTYDGVTSNFHKTVPLYFHRSSGGVFTDASACGNETASERRMMRKFIIDSLLFWVEEYQMDGFRFDLMGIHDTETMREIEKALRSVKPDILLYGEGWTGGNSPLHEDLRLVKRNISQVPGIGAFNDDIRDGIKGHVFFNEKGGFVSSRGQRESVKLGITGAVYHPQVNYRKILYTDFPWAQNPGQSINYVSAHDNLTLYDKLEAANKGKSKEVLKDMAKLANTIVLTSQGVPFLHAGVEFLRTKYGDHNSYRSSDKVNALNWSQKSRNIDVVQYYKGLIALRKEYPAFRLRTAEEIGKYLSFYGPEDRNFISYTLKDPNGFYTLLVAFNGGENSFKLRIPSAHWDVLLDKDDADILPLWSTKETSVTLKPYSAMILMTRDSIS